MSKSIHGKDYIRTVRRQLEAEARRREHIEEAWFAFWVVMAVVVLPAALVNAGRALGWL